MKKLKYIGAYFSPLLALLSFQLQGFGAFLCVFILYVIVPISEQFLPQDTYNLSKSEKELAKADPFYDWILYLLVPLHLFVIYTYLTKISSPEIQLTEIIAYTMTIGTILGINGINGGHELGHKTNEPIKLFCAHILLATSLQNHFMTYHNSGHHRDVATPDDLTTAKKGQSFYHFAIQSQIGGYFKTWKLERKITKTGKEFFSQPHDFTHLNSMVSTSFCFHLFWMDNRNVIFTSQYFWYFNARISELFFSLWANKK